MSDKESKTEKPTPQRLQEARSQGQIARSQDLVAWASIFATFSILQMSVGRAASFLQKSVDEMAKLIEKPDVATAMAFAGKSVKDGFIAIAPLMIAFMVLVIIGHLLQVKIIFTLKAMKPSWAKMNPIAGVKRLFSAQSAFMAAKQSVYAIVIGYIAYKTLYGTITGLVNNGPYSVSELVRIGGGATVSFVKQAAFAGIVIGIIDYLFMRHKTKKGMMMTKEEVKQESKNQDLSPEIRGKIRQKQMSMSRNRMMAAVQDADAVIVNPVHIAIALKYDPVKGAPRVVAKGAGFVAEKIRERADEERVPVIQDIPLARVLHKTCEIDDEIPAQMFEAVARLLAFVFSLKNRGTAAGFHKMPGTPDLEEADRLEAAVS